MNIAKKKGINLALIFTLLLSLVVPSMAFAEIEHKDTGSLTIHKYKQEKGAKQGTQTGPTAQVPEGSVAIAGVTYKIQQTHSFDGKDWTEVSGKAIEKDTGENGEAVFSELPVGRYSVQEVSGPEGVILNKEVFHVDIPMTYNEGKDISYDVHIYPKNEIVRGDAELTKVDEEGNPLPGAVFGLYKEDGTKIGDDLTTDENGKIKAEGLEAGKYYFQEIKAPEGFTLNKTKIEFLVKKNKDRENSKDETAVTEIEWLTDNYVVKGDKVTNFNKPAIDKDAEGEKVLPYDRDKEFTYNLKITTPGDIENYKAIGVTDTLDDRLTFISNGSLQDGWTVTGTERNNVTFKQVGQKLIWEIDPTKLAANTDITITFTAKIKPDAVLGENETGIENTADLHFNNGKGSFTKPADPNNPDPYEPGEEDPEEPTEEPPTPEEPPVVVPTEGGMKVIKVDKSDNNIKLEGAEFKLTTDKEGEKVVNATGTTIKVNGVNHTGELKDLVTGANGEFTIEGLTPGTYYLHETKAPTYEEDGQTKSYRLLTKPVEVEVKNNKTENLDVVVENSKSGWELPTTGGIGTILFTLAGLALMGIALFAYVRRNRESAAQ